MLTLPAHIMARLDPFAPVCSRRVWRHVPTLVGGAILAPGRRMVSSALRVMGLGHCRAFSTYHRVLNRAVWSHLRVSRILLGMLIAAFAPDGPLVIGLDATLERRRGPKIGATGIYRDPVRSSHSHFVKVRALRWVSMMLLVPIPWAHWTWALPFLTVLAPSDRYDEEREQRHKAVPRWAQQMILQLHRWYPDRALVVVGDQEYAVIDLLAATRPVATIVTRLRLDAHLCEPAPPRLPHQKGRPRVVGPRLPTLAARAADPTTAWTALTVARWYGEDQRDIEIVSGTAVWYHGGKPPVPLRWVLIRDPRDAFPTQALLCTDLDAPPEQIVAWFVLRWQVETTFHEVRDHLGVETQRQWSDLAIRRVTPALLGLFSFVTLLAHDQITAGACPVRQAAWYPKRDPTFADALALVRRSLWAGTTFCMSPPGEDIIKVPRALVDHLSEMLCYAA